MLTFHSEQCIRALFTDPQITLFSNFFIKNGSHGTIHTFKNYFATVFLVFNFQFQQKKFYPNRPLDSSFLSIEWMMFVFGFKKKIIVRVKLGYSGWKPLPTQTWIKLKKKKKKNRTEVTKAMNTCEKNPSMSVKRGAWGGWLKAHCTVSVRGKWGYICK